jgi:hypothetical protein
MEKSAVVFIELLWIGISTYGHPAAIVAPTTTCREAESNKSNA